MFLNFEISMCIIYVLVAGRAKVILSIYGAGGAGRSINEVVKIINKKNHFWSKVIFIDDINNDRFVHGIEVLSLDNAMKIYNKDIQFCISVGEPELRACLKNKVLDLGYSLTSIIHPYTYIAETSKHKDGLILREGSRLSNDSILGANNSFENYSIFGHDSVMGENCQVSAHTVIAGNCEIGDNVFFGASSAVMQGIKIGSNSIISMGAMVFKDVPEGVIVSGNPARIISENINKKVF